MTHNSKILITGGHGFLGSALNAVLPYKIINVSSSLFDLTYQDNVYCLMDKYNPDVIIHCASRVGGLGAHKNKNIDFITDNSIMNLNLFSIAKEYNVKKFVSISSVAAFPGEKMYLRPNDIYNGEVHQSEKGYAHSKRLLDSLTEIYAEENTACNYSCVFPVNIYGPNDNFNIQTGHVIGSLIHKIYLAKKENKDLEVWGDGLSLREFIYVEDLATLIFKLINMLKMPKRVIAAYPTTYNIKQVVDTLSDIADFRGGVIYSGDRNGLRARETDTSIMKEIYQPQIDLDNGLKITWDWFQNNYESARK